MGYLFGSMSILSQISCTPCQGNEHPVSDEEVAELHPLVPAWSIERGDGVRKLCNTFTFESPKKAEEFIERLQEIARRENHHPALDVQEKSVTVTWSTRAIGDLHPNDFIMAGKADGIYTLVAVGNEGDMFTDEPLPTIAEVPRFQRTFARRQQEKAEPGGNR